MIYADDEEAGGERIGDEDGDANVGGAHKKYGLEEGGIVVCRPDGYGTFSETLLTARFVLLIHTLALRHLFIVGIVVPLEEKGWAALERYFNGFLQISSHMSKL